MRRNKTKQWGEFDPAPLNHSFFEYDKGAGFNSHSDLRRLRSVNHVLIEEEFGDVMKVMGIDPGLGLTGYGLIETRDKNINLIEAGFIRSSYTWPIATRLNKIYKEMTDIIAEHKPDVLALEEIYSHYKHPTTAILMGHVRGVVSLIGGQKNIPVYSYSATRIKKAVTGQGNASKEQVQRMVQTLLRLRRIPKQTDVTDALALAVGHVYISRVDG